MGQSKCVRPFGGTPRHAKVSEPDKDGRVVVRDDEAREGEARERLVQSLDAAEPGWRTLLDIQPPHEAESAPWIRRHQTQEHESG